MKEKNYTLVVWLKLAISAIVTLFGLDEQRNRLEPITADSVDPIDAELAETITLGDATAHKFAKHLRRATNKDRRNAFATLLGLPHAIEDSALGWSMFLLCLLSTVAELVIGTIPSLPLIVLTGLTAAPCALRTLIESFSPLRKLAGKRGCIKRPTVLEATAPLGSTAVSSDLVDYLGGKLKVTGYGKLRAWLPLALVPIAVAANVPSAVVDALLTSSPFALLTFCGVRKLNSSRFTFRWDGITFESADLTLLNDAKAQMSLIQAELLCFCEYIRATKGRRKRIIEGVADFYPVAHSGRFTKTLDAEPEIRIWAAALSTLRELLRFASEKADWCSREGADRWLLEAWQSVLPESAPTPPNENTVAVRGDSVSVFWDFLTCYVRGHLPLVADKPRSNPTAIATLAAFDDGRYVVFPRGQLLVEYNAYLNSKDSAQLSTANDGIVLAHLLRDNWGSAIKFESESDISWRYQFYAKGAAPKGRKNKIPCIALPLSALPDELRDLLADCSGIGSGEVNSSPSTRPPPERKNPVEVSKNA